MKNIHLLSTVKPSRLVGTRLNLSLKNIPVPSFEAFKTYNIYITSDEEIKEGFVLHLYTNRILEVGVITESNGNKSFIEKNYHINGIEVLICDCKKIILTTDQELIKDDVQEIDDEFLEWFVKNPNCEWVVVEKKMLCDYCGEENCDNLRCRGYKDSPYYKIIIPKEEPKQETIEEAAEKFYPPKTTDLICSPKLVRGSFIAGAKWQQEQNKNLYSEDDMIEFADFYYQYKELIKLEKWEIIEISKKDVFKKWFEQYKRNKL